MKIYVIFGSTGEYSDRTEWPVKAVKDLDRAQEIVTLASEYANTLFAKFENEEVSKHSNEGQELVSKNPHDPEMKMDYTGTSYYYTEVELEE